MTRSNPPRPLVSESSIPAVPEFSMPPSSGSTPAPKKKSEKSSNGGRFKIVFKGNTTSEQENTAIASPLPQPHSPSAPASSTFSSTASPDPDSSKTAPASSLVTSTSDLPSTLGPTASTSQLPPDGESSTAEVVVSRGKKEKKEKGSKGKGKKGKKSSKRRNKEALLEGSLAEASTSTAGSVQPPPTELENRGTGEAESTGMVRSTSLNRVCHHHKSWSKGELKMTCSNNPECRTMWCKVCVEKYYLDSTPSTLFIQDTTFLCPVCTDRCKCSNCKKKRKEAAKETKRANSAAARASSERTFRSMTPAGGLGGEAVVKMEEGENENEDRKPIVPSHSASTDPFLLPSSTSTSSLPPPTNSAEPSKPPSSSSFAIPPPPLPPSAPSTATATPSGILKIRVKPPKRPRTERGTYVPQDGHEEEIVVTPPVVSRRGRGGARRGAGRRNMNVDTHGYAQTREEGSLPGGGGGTSFFGRPPSLLAGVGVAAAGGIRPKRTKKVSSHYDDFAVEGVPNFVEGAMPGPGGGGFVDSTPEMSRVQGAGGRETRSGGGRWGGYRRGAGGRKKIVDPFDSHQAHHSLTNSTPLFPSSSTLCGSDAMLGRDGKPRRTPRLSGLSSASSCSELSSAGGMDDEDDYEATYWAAKEALAERESDQRVRHWLLVPPTEPQPVLAGLERNLSEGGGEEVGFSPTSSNGLKTKKEKVKWIEGPERRRRRAIALQRMREEEDAKMKDLSQGVVDDEGGSAEGEPKRPLKRSLSWDAGELTNKSKDLYNHCSPIKPFGDGVGTSASSTSSATQPPLPLPIRPASAPLLSASSTVDPPAALPTQSQTVEQLYSDQPPPYESHFPPKIDSPLPSSARYQPPAIVVSPATTAPQSPHPVPFSAPISPTSTAPSPHSTLTGHSTSLTSEADADLAARSADDKRLGLRLLDAIRTITGTKLAMEAMGIPPSALPTPAPTSTLAPSTSTSPAVAHPSSSTASAPHSALTTSPIKSESEDAFSHLISQEHAEYEALRREERQRLLSTALDPQKVFRAEAKGNDVSLLDRAAEWVGGGMDVDSDESEKKFKALDATNSIPMFDLESFLVSGSAGGEYTSGSVMPSTSATPARLGSNITTSPLHLNHVPSSITIPVPETPSKLLHSHNHLSAPIPSLDTAHPWSSASHIGGAATPTRGLVMELDFDFENVVEGGIGRGESWPSSLE